MKILKTIVVFICAALILVGILYNVFATPFSNPKFDLIAWCAIGVAFLVLVIIGRRVK